MLIQTERKKIVGSVIVIGDCLAIALLGVTWTTQFRGRITGDGWPASASSAGVSHSAPVPSSPSDQLMN